MSLCFFLFPSLFVVFICCSLVYFICCSLVYFICCSLVYFICCSLVYFICCSLVYFICCSLVYFICCSLVCIYLPYRQVFEFKFRIVYSKASPGTVIYYIVRVSIAVATMGLPITIVYIFCNFLPIVFLITIVNP